jgi:hypothetical protein
MNGTAISVITNHAINAYKAFINKLSAIYAVACSLLSIVSTLGLSGINSSYAIEVARLATAGIGPAIA